MKNIMWKLSSFLVAISLALTFASCEKQEDTKASVSFDIYDGVPSLKKDGGSVSGKQNGVPECVEGTPTTVQVVIDGTLYNLDVLGGLDGGNKTTSLKLSTGNHVVSSFEVYNEDGVILWVTPLAGSDYALLWPQLSTVDLSFNVADFTKAEVPVDVLCYRDADYEAFGFTWFKFHAYESKSVCFFGDICSKFYEDFNEAEGPYNGQVEAHDFIALFNATVYGPDGEVMNTGTNVEGDLNAPVCVEYLDDLDVADEVFTFSLDILGPMGEVVAVATGSFTDAEWSGNESDPKFGGDDGVWEFVVGNCISENTDAVVLPAYLALPDEGRIKILTTKHNGTTYDYFDVKLLGSSWDASSLYPEELFENAILPGWCGDLKTRIGTGEYNVDVYSSLKPSEMPLSPENGDGLALPDYPWDVLNYVANLDLVNPSPNKLAGQRLQSIVWLIIHGTDATTIASINAQGAGYTVTASMLSEANALMVDGAGFSPQTGDWSVVVMTPYRGTEPDLKWFQFVLVRVDP